MFGADLVIVNAVILDGPGLTAIVLGVFLFASAVQRVLGFGFALVVLGLLPMVFDVAETTRSGVRLAHLTSSIAALVPLLLMVWQFHELVDRRALLVTILGAACGLPVGLVIFEVMTPEMLSRLTGGMLLLLVIDVWRRKPGGGELPPLALKWGGLAGLCAGVLHGSIGVPGPPVVIYAARRGWSPNAFRGFVAASMILISLSKVGLFAARGHIDAEVLRWSSIALPAVVAGYLLGAAIADRVPFVWFRRLVLGVVALSAVQLLWPSR